VPTPFASVVAPAVIRHESRPERLNPNLIIDTLFRPGWNSFLCRFATTLIRSCGISVNCRCRKPKVDLVADTDRARSGPVLFWRETFFQFNAGVEIHLRGVHRFPSEPHRDRRAVHAVLQDAPGNTLGFQRHAPVSCVVYESGQNVLNSIANH
jgi:hypothetical protein